MIYNKTEILDEIYIKSVEEIKYLYKEFEFTN